MYDERMVTPMRQELTRLVQEALNNTVKHAGGTAAVVMMDGCMTCLSCGDSKCG